MGLIGSLGQVAYDIVANDRTGEGTGSSQKSLMAVGAAMTGVGIASKLMVDDVNSAYLKFDESTTAVKALGSLSEEEFQRARDAALDLSTQVPISASEVTDAMYSMVSVGYDYNTMMETIPEATKLAVGGNQELKESIDTVINVMGAYGEGTYSAADITNILAKSVGVGKWELGDFTTEMQKNVGVAAQLGISFEDTAAANVLLQNKFTSAEEAGTAFKTMLLRLVDPKVQADLEELGIHVKDNEGNFVGLESVLDQLDTALQTSGGSVDKMSVLQQIFGTEGLRAAMALVDEKDKLGEMSAAMNDATFKNEAYNTVLESTSSQLEIANNKMEVAKIKLGEGMAPATILAADAMSGFADLISGLPEPLQGVGGMALYAAQGFAALGPLLMGISALKGLGLLSTLTGIASGVKAIGVSGIAAVAGLGPLLPILIGLGLGLAVVYAMKELGFLDWVTEQGENAGEALSDFQQGLVLWRNNTASQFADWRNDVEGSVSGIGDAFGNVGGSISGALSSVPGLLSNTFADISSAFSFLGSEVQTAFSSVFTGISDYIVNLAQGFISAGYNIIMYIVQGMQSAAGSVGSAISDVLSTIWNFLPHSPALEGPLSKLPDFSSYFTQGLEASIPAVQNASMEVMANILPSAQPAAMGTGTSIGSQDNSASISIGNINASKDYSVSDMMTDFASSIAAKRKQKGYPSVVS